MSARVKFRQIHHVSFELTSQFHFKFFIIIHSNYTELLCKFLAHSFSTLGKRIPSKSQFRHFQVFWWKFAAKFLISFLKQQVSFSSNFDSSVSWKITLLYFFRSNVIFFAEKMSIKVQLFETLECSNQNSPNSCHFWNSKSVFFQISHHTSVLWVLRLCTFLVEILCTFSKRRLSKCKLVKLHVGSWKFEIFPFDGVYLSKSCTIRFS